MPQYAVYSGFRNAVVDSVGIPDRIQKVWIAGQRGKPSLNADILNTTEATRMIADPDFEVLGTNMTSALSTHDAEGGINLTTAGADADQAILLPHLDANQTTWSTTTWGSDQETDWECVIQTGANITNCIIWAGLKLTNVPVTGTDADQVFFRYEDDNNDGELEAVSSIGGTDTEYDTGIVIAVSTLYHLRISIDAQRKATFYVQGAPVTTTAALTDAKDFIPYIGVMADGAAAAKAINVRGIAMSRNYA